MPKSLLYSKLCGQSFIWRIWANNQNFLWNTKTFVILRHCTHKQEWTRLQIGLAVALRYTLSQWWNGIRSLHADSIGFTINPPLHFLSFNQFLLFTSRQHSFQLFSSRFWVLLPSSAWPLTAGMLSGSVLSSLPFLLCILSPPDVVVYRVRRSHVCISWLHLYIELCSLQFNIDCPWQLCHHVPKSKVDRFPSKRFSPSLTTLQTCISIHFLTYQNNRKTNMPVPWLLLCLTLNI